MALGCRLRALDLEALDVWFWNGFGMLVVDVIRGLHPVETAASPDPAVRVRAFWLRHFTPVCYSVLRQKVNVAGLAKK